MVIKHHDLWRLGLVNELIGLGLCLLVGFIFGLVTGAVNVTGANWGSTDSWPTSKMHSR